MQHKVNQFLGEKSGQNLRAEIYSEENGYTIKYFINETLQNTKKFEGKPINFVEDEAKTWIAMISVLNG